MCNKLQVTGCELQVYREEVGAYCYTPSIVYIKP